MSDMSGDARRPGTEREQAQAQERACQAIEETTRLLDGMTRLLDAPEGFLNPALLRERRDG